MRQAIIVKWIDEQGEGRIVSHWGNVHLGDQNAGLLICCFPALHVDLRAEEPLLEGDDEEEIEGPLQSHNRGWPRKRA